MISDNDNVMSIRLMIPAYAQDDSDYSPWMLGHLDKQQLNDEVLNALWEQACQEQKIDFGNMPPADFAEYLEACQKGYVVFYTVPELYVLPVRYNGNWGNEGTDMYAPIDESTPS